MTTLVTRSSDGTRIAYTTTGDPGLPGILLIHGWAQQFICWRPIVERLSKRFHIVCMDLRGHGASDKPQSVEAYTESDLWGSDVQAVITASNLDRPVLCGWSYGSRVIAAHLASFGDAHLSGVALVGGILAIGAAREDWMVGPASPALDKDLFSEEVPLRLAATARFVEACTAHPLERSYYAELVGANMLCPAHVRRALFQTDLDFGPVYGAMNCPGLVIHGTADAVVTAATGERAADLIPGGRYVPYLNLGHAPFLDAPDRFAEDFAAFVTACRD
ncbi:alpha/beta fold hydrolase [Marimonas sp. MJW-29]|uniref:Alpha/beta fold hydrolase n=1 Tax=Sulfitobacter sediminis TaxID=3234186 RepID=A0ABV3RMT9_9RHOB